MLNAEVSSNLLFMNDMLSHLSDTIFLSTLFTRHTLTHLACLQNRSSKSGLEFQQGEWLLLPFSIHTSWMSKSPQPSILRITLETIQSWDLKVIVLWRQLLTPKKQERMSGPRNHPLQWPVIRCLQHVWKRIKSLCQTLRTHGTMNPQWDMKSRKQNLPSKRVSTKKSSKPG